ncbi:MAG: LysM peptidoglycan-binding domain-containing protein [Chloroflexi bacterium]|nr:LysM peptidoglycan-binding domain-containing protein [Chloroflexota bacterium]
MRVRFHYRFPYFLIAALALTLQMCSGSAPAEEEPVGEPLTASMAEVIGTVQTLKPADGFYTDSFVGEELVIGDQVLTHSDGRARIDISDSTFVRIGPLSNFTLQRLEQQPDGIIGRIFMEIGEMWISLNSGSFEVETPSGLAAVRGSLLNVWVTKDTQETVITCMEGECQLQSNAGVVNLLAGQKASVSDMSALPVDSFLDEEDIEKWLEFNPEMADVIPIMEATQNALLGISPTPLPPELQAGTETAEALLNATDANCGPPDGWVLYSIQEGDTLDSLAAEYGISDNDLQQANCLGDSIVLVADQSVYVPPPPTATVTATSTAEPTATETPLASPTITSTPSPTTMLSPTVTNTPGPSIAFTDIIGPNGPEEFCAHDYGATVTDADGIAWVRVEYALNDQTMSNPSSFDLNPNGNFWSKLKSLTMTSSDIVYWRFRAADSLDNEAFFPAPADAPFEFTTNFGCSES